MGSADVWIKYASHIKQCNFIERNSYAINAIAVSFLVGFHDAPGAFVV